MASTATKTFKNFIGGEWVDAASGETFETKSPATGEVLGVFPQSSAEDVDRAVEAAKAAYEEWRLVPAPRRGEILFRFGALLAEHKDELAAADDARDGQGAARGGAATSRKRST